MDCSPSGSSVCGISQARILERIVISFSRGSSWSKNRTQVSCIAGGFFTNWAMRGRITIIKNKSRNKKCQWGCKIGTLFCCQWEFKIVQKLWSLRNLNIEPSPSNCALRHRSKITESRDLNRYLYTNVQKSIIHNTQNMNQPKCPSVNE